MSDGESIAGREREVTFHTTGALTREQVEEAFNAVYWHGDQQGVKQCKVLDGVDTLRATITQQAQELDAIKNALGCHRAYIVESINDLKAKTEDIPNIDRMRQVEQQLADAQATISRLEDRIDLQCDEFQRISALTENDEVKGLCARAVKDIRQHVPVIQQRDTAEQQVARLKGEDK